MHKQFDILLKSRQLILKIIEDLSMAQINKIPKGFNNNIAWNLGHLLVTQQLLCYKFSHLECEINKSVIEKFKKGTAPSFKVSKEELNAFKKQFFQLPTLLTENYKNGIFIEYSPYTTSINVTLNSIEDAIEFNNYHEGIHLGIILQLKKLV